MNTWFKHSIQIFSYQAGTWNHFMTSKISRRQNSFGFWPKHLILDKALKIINNIMLSCFPILAWSNLTIDQVNLTFFGHFLLQDMNKSKVISRTLKWVTPVSDYSSKLDDLDMSEGQFSLSNHFVVNLTICLDTEIITNCELSVFTMGHDSWISIKMWRFMFDCYHFKLMYTVYYIQYIICAVNYCQSIYCVCLITDI